MKMKSKRKRKTRKRGGMRKFSFYNSRTLPRAITDNVKRHGLGETPTTNKRDVKTEEDCAICGLSLMEGDNPIVKTTCGHYFHNDCLAQWFNTRHYTCPICRHHFTKKERDYDFDSRTHTTIMVPDHNVKKVFDESSKLRHLSEEQIDSIANQYPPSKVEYIKDHLRRMIYDKNYRSPFDGTSLDNLYQQASHKVSYWYKDGGRIDDDI